MIPLSEQMRPKTLDDWVGHENILSPGRPLYEAIQKDLLFSFILYAPPGTGKTSLCQLIKNYSKSRFISLSAVSAGIKDVKAAIEEARLWKQRQDRETILFIDEIHRFNKGQQDALLPAVEDGTITLIGATTENPSYELNSALLSRVRVFRFESLTEDDLLKILEKANSRFESPVKADLLQMIADKALGDARVALSALELVVRDPTVKQVEEVFQSKRISYDKSGDQHYQVISAFIKSMRAGQTDAAMYYLARMWHGGEDPLFIARRMVIFASEDVGNADLRAIALANAVRHAVEFVGRPECYYALSQGVLYLSRAAKSREAGDFFQKALATVQRTGAKPVPDFLINPVTALDRQLGRGRARKADESYLPFGIEEDESSTLNMTD